MRQLMFGPSEQVDEKAETTLLVHFFGKKGKAELKFEDFYKWVEKPFVFDYDVPENTLLSLSNIISPPCKTSQQLNPQ